MTKDTKPDPVAKTHGELINTLKERGLGIECETITLDTLQHIDYFRIKGYYLHLQQKDCAEFVPGTSFRQVVALHNFDSNLRLLLLALLFDIEIDARARIAYSVGHAWGALGYRDVGNYHERNRDDITRLLASIDQNLERSKEFLVRKYRKEHKSDFPVWIAVEAMSFGDLSKLFSLLPTSQKKFIANTYESLDEELLGSWLHAAAVLRNICAHNCRIYNRHMPIPIVIEKVIKDKASAICPRFMIYPTSLFAYMLSIRRMSNSNSWDLFVRSFICLTENYTEYIQMVQMGFPFEWRDILLEMKR